MASIIDSHHHVWDETAAGKAPGPMGPGNYSAQAQASVELFMDYMDEAAVDKAVFVQPWFYHWDNSYMIECARRYPDRFRAVCVIDPRGPGAAAALKKWHWLTISTTRSQRRACTSLSSPRSSSWPACPPSPSSCPGFTTGVKSGTHTGTACPSWKHGWNRGAALVQLVHEERGVVPHEDPRSACSMGLVWHRERLA